MSICYHKAIDFSSDAIGLGIEGRSTLIHSVIPNGVRGVRNPSSAPKIFAAPNLPVPNECFCSGRLPRRALCPGRKLSTVRFLIGAQLNGQNPAGRFHSKVFGDILSVGGKLKTEIPVYLASARQDIGFLKGW